MNEEQKQLIREKISEILIKWEMPTRQSAINEIIAEFDLAIKKTEERIVNRIEWRKKEYKVHEDGEYHFGDNMKTDGYNQALDDILTLIRNK